MCFKNASQTLNQIEKSLPTYFYWDSIIKTANDESPQKTNRIIVTQPTGNVWEFENEWRHKLTDCCVDSKQCFCAFTCYCCLIMELYSRTGWGN